MEFWRGREEAGVIRHIVTLLLSGCPLSIKDGQSGTTAIGPRAIEASFLTQACYPGGVEQRAKGHR